MASCSLLVVPLAAFGALRVASALRSGTMDSRSGSFRRQDQPVRFGVTLAALTFAVGACCLMMVGLV